MLPADDSSFGFDNIAGSLGVSPVLLERYVAAAGKISRLALGDTAMPDRQEKYLVSGDLTQNQHLPGMPFGTRGGATFTHHFPVDAEYIIRADLVERGGRMFGANNGKTEQLEVTLDGQRVLLAELAEYEVEDGAAIRMAAEGRPAYDRRRVHQEESRTRRRRHPTVRVQPVRARRRRRSRLDVRAAPREHERDGALQYRRRQRHADAAANLRLSACE